MPQETLERALRSVPQVRNEHLLIGSETFDDAGVYRLTRDIALVQTIDVFTPVVDDPYDYGAITAANSLSDVYAMGGTPLTALSFVGFPADLDIEIMTRMCTGAADKVRESGAVIAGGHTVIDKELKFGLAVTGVVHPDRIVTNAGVRPGDRLVLTKRLGTGFLGTGIKKGLLTPQQIADVTAEMATLNRAAAEAMVEVGVSAATDITGFGFLGHALEVARSSGVTLRFSAGAMPAFAGVFDLMSETLCGGTGRNRSYTSPHVLVADGVTDEQMLLMYDAQTSGGLLIAVRLERFDDLMAALEVRGVATRAVVGEALPASDRPLAVIP
jgi:selenide,water dikinase